MQFLPELATRISLGLFEISRAWTSCLVVLLQVPDIHQLVVLNLTNFRARRSELFGLQGVAISFRHYVVGSCQVLTGFMTSAGICSVVEFSVHRFRSGAFADLQQLSLLDRQHHCDYLVRT